MGKFGTITKKLFSELAKCLKEKGGMNSVFTLNEPPRTHDPHRFIWFHASHLCIFALVLFIILDVALAICICWRPEVLGITLENDGDATALISAINRTNRYSSRNAAYRKSITEESLMDRYNRFGISVDEFGNVGGAVRFGEVLKEHRRRAASVFVNMSQA